MICAGYPGIGGKDSCQGKSDILLDQVTKTPLYLLKYSVFDFFVQVIQVDHWSARIMRTVKLNILVLSVGEQDVLTQM